MTIKSGKTKQKKHKQNNHKTQMVIKQIRNTQKQRIIKINTTTIKSKTP